MCYSLWEPLSFKPPQVSYGTQETGRKLPGCLGTSFVACNLPHPLSLKEYCFLQGKGGKPYVCATFILFRNQRMQTHHCLSQSLMWIKWLHQMSTVKTDGRAERDFLAVWMWLSFIPDQKLLLSACPQTRAGLSKWSLCSVCLPVAPSQVSTLALALAIYSASPSDNLRPHSLTPRFHF